MTAPVLDLRRATFGYDGVPVVHEVTLTIQAGEVVAVLGPNGSGKSTLVKGLLGLADHIGGQAQAFGQSLDAAANRGRIGYVPQRHTLATSVRATVSEIVAIGRLRFRTWWRPWARDSARDRQEIARALDLVGLGDRAGSDVGHLSGGQQRRVLIARALASAPELLVMDEPTAGVDQANQQVLAAVLARLADTGTTMLVVTHEIAALADVVTRVVAVSDGVVAFDGTPEAYAVAGHHDLHAHHDHSAPGRTTIGLDEPALPGARRHA
ncbi:MAG: metal ABC transporter ATP-binding protein [Tetrasphaera sp.]|jgi:zinc transport system ATP-binding protein|nr:metal ABC transporter ATP-binding protein [Tetrasphaera sp.]